MSNYEIASIIVEIDGDEFIQSVANLFFPLANTKNAAITIAIFATEKNDIAYLYYQSGFEHADKIINLSTIDYAYHKEKNEFFAHNASLFGQICLSDFYAKWYFVRGELPLRSLLQYAVLDTLSLFSPEMDIVFIHGAAFLYNEEVSVLLGPSGCGKSTINFMLQKSNDQFLALSDDTLALKLNDDFCVYPINTGFGYNEATARRLVRCSGYSVLHEEQQKIYVMPPDFIPTNAGYKVGKAFFINGMPNNDMQRVSKHDSLVRLLKTQKIIYNPLFKQQYGLLKKFAKNTEFYTASREKYVDKVLSCICMKN